MFKTIILLLFLKIVLVDCTGLEWVKPSRMGSSRNICGGKACKTQHPYTHQISLRKHGKHICGGSIISERMVLTAAHCVYRDSTKYLHIVAGAHTLSDVEYTYLINSTLIHPNYNINNTNLNDIAVIITKDDIEFNDKVNKIPIYDGYLEGGKVCLATGWGASALNGPLTHILQEIKVNSLTNTYCRSSQPHPTTINDNTQICTHQGLKKCLCQGDSGGPLTFKNQLVGIVSWGRGCTGEYPDVFTRVYGFTKWIHDTETKHVIKKCDHQ